MPRGGHKVKPAKTTPAAEASPSLRVPSIFGTSKTSTDSKTSLSTPVALSRTPSESRLTVPVIDRSRDSSRQPTPRRDLSADSARVRADSTSDERSNVTSIDSTEKHEDGLRPTSSRASSIRSAREEDTYEAVLNTFESLSPQSTQSSASSSLYSRDSASIYSSASSIYSFEESDETDSYNRKGSSELTVRETDVSIDSRLPGGLQYQQLARTTTVRRQEPQDTAARERSTLARKAALFKNSRLQPQLPSFNTSLPTWSMVCRAIQASEDCYDSRALLRRGAYTAADSSKDIKAMIVDDQLIDESRIVVVSIRGTQFQSLSDWAVNKAANPTKPIGFLDDEENACHAGFLQVTKAMVAQVAAQLKQHPACSESPTLMFTGHSAGGAVAAMLYSHMMSTSVSSDLTALASKFSSINCVTFGAPPLSLTPLPKRDHLPGVFLSFANEGDPVLRLTNASYMKSLVKLMTASPPASTAAVVAAPPVKVVRGSRGATVYRQAPTVAPVTPWEELPLWPTPPASLTNAGEVILLRDEESGSATASRVTSEDLSDVIFGDLAQHTCAMYMRRIKEVSLAAMMGRNVL